MPDALVTPLVMVAVYTLFTSSALVGAKDALDPEYVTIPATAVVPCFSVKVEVVMVKGFIGTLKFALTILPRITLVALLVGSVEITVGAILPVVNVHT
jgi:hypothetical protein